MVALPWKLSTQGGGREVARSGEEAESTDFPYLDLAAARRSASFCHVVDAHFCGYPRERVILEAFERRHGAIVQLHFFEKIGAGVVCTTKQEIFVSCHTSHPLSEPDVEKLIHQCQMLHYDAMRLLSRGADLRACSSMSYAGIVHLLGLLEDQVDSPPTKGARRGPEETRSKVVRFVEGEIKGARRYFEQAAQREARIQYFFGMIWGTLLAAAVLLALAAMIAEPGASGNWGARLMAAGNHAVVPGIGSFIAGGIGAVVSVMARMNSGKCTLDFMAGRKILKILGGFRPLIGGIFGLASFVFLQAGLLSTMSLQQGRGTPYHIEALCFLWGLAFVAGFSERAAQDMLAIAGRTMSPDSQSDSPPVTPPGPLPVARPASRAPRAEPSTTSGWSSPARLP